MRGFTFIPRVDRAVVGQAGCHTIEQSAKDRRRRGVEFHVEILFGAPAVIGHLRQDKDDRSLGEIGAPGEFGDAAEHDRAADGDRGLLLVGKALALLQTGAGGEAAKRIGELIVDRAQIVETEEPVMLRHDDEILFVGRRCRNQHLRRVDELARDAHRRAFDCTRLTVEDLDRIGSARP